ncbi:hypothetical protein [Thermoactinospora rubra]|nr:hypothetical protein [Thermoactinospora rubra]
MRYRKLHRPFPERDPLWRRILLAVLNIAWVGVLLMIVGMMFLLYFDGPR